MKFARGQGIGKKCLEKYIILLFIQKIDYKQLYYYYYDDELAIEFDLTSIGGNLYFGLIDLKSTYTFCLSVFRMSDSCLNVGRSSGFGAQQRIIKSYNSSVQISGRFNRIPCLKVESSKSLRTDSYGRAPERKDFSQKISFCLWKV